RSGFWRAALVAGLLASLAGCGGGSPTEVLPPVSVSVTPTSASVQISGTQRFVATITNDSSNGGVSWSVNGQVGGSSTAGVISADGVYTAPSTMPAPATVTVSATSKVESTASASASVTITGAPITVAIAPMSPSVQVSQTQAFTVTLQNDTQSQGVTWSL